ncbi:FecR family protein [Sphingobacterium sp. LRF_L2]|uniref:FecR family protein n=1 Tax=Sphingobacterium sp. LRF_L2 TaxID=3369421 RepID=UPI003F602EDA
MSYKKEEESIYVAKIIVKELQGLATAEELLFLESWVKQSEDNRVIFEACKDSGKLQSVESQFRKYDSKKAYNHVLKRSGITTNATRVQKIQRWIPYLAAAVVLLVFAFSFYWFKSNQTMPSTVADVESYAPAGNKATIQLSDGRTFQLDEHREGVQIDQRGVRYSDGKSLVETPAVVHAKISTPRGGVYQVTLPDGSIVKLNAGSSLTYPSVFQGENRVVSLEGEAYFAVAKKENQPFIVQARGQQVKVLGTHFNVAAYAEDEQVKTTLVEGRVVVNRTHTDGLLLAPGEQALLQGGKLYKQAVDVEQELAWFHGKFNFDGKSLRQVMTELGRWYDVDVVYQGAVPQVEFYGGTFRDVQLVTILRVLKNHNLNYTLTADRRLVISASNEVK